MNIPMMTCDLLVIGIAYLCVPAVMCGTAQQTNTTRGLENMNSNGNSASVTAYAPAPWYALFLVTLEATANVAAACRAADISRQTAYRHKGEDDLFRTVWEDAEDNAVDKVEANLFRIAVDEDNVQAMQLILKAHRHKYRDNQPIVQVNNYTTIDGVPAAQALMASIDAVRDRQQAHESKALTEGEDG